MSPELAAGAELAGFRIERLVGAGGMGAVYLATDATLKRHVALKVIAPELADDPQFRERFLVEAELAARLEHPAIVPVYHAGDSEGRLFLVMRYVPGGSLAELLATREPLSPEDVVTLLQPIAAALDAAHEAGLIHRDVKPANILLEEGRAYLADFGLARRAASADSLVRTSTAQVSGTMAYVAPEQIEGNTLSARSDQYALACVAFECLTGRAPFDRSDALAVIYAHLAETPPSASERRSELPRSVDAVLARGLAKRPEQRFASCSELIDELADACGVVPGATARRRRRRLVVAVAAAVVAVAAGAATFATSREGTHRPPIADPLVVINGSSGKVVDRVAAAGAPTAIAAGGGAIWSLDGLHGTITRLDPRTRAPVGQPLGVSGAVDLAVGDGGLWVSTGSSTLHGDTSGAFPRADRIQEFDPNTLVPVGQPIPLPKAQRFIALGGELALTPGAVWVVGSDGSVIRVDLASRRAKTVEQFGGEAHGIAAAGDAVWVMGPEDVWHIDPATLDAVPIPLNPPEGMQAITAGGGAAWAASWGDGALWRIDARPPFRARAINARPQITALAYDGGKIWAASDRSDDVFEIDPATSTTRTIPVGGTVNGIAVAGGSVWVPSPGAGTAVSGTASDRVGATCSDVVAGAVARPQFLVVSDEPLTGALGTQGTDMADAALAELRARRFRAGPYTLGFQSCNDATPDGDVADAACSANAKAYAETPRVLGVVGNLTSDCAGAMLPFLATAPGGPLPLVSPANSSDSLALAGFPNLARLITTDDTDIAATVVLARRLGIRRLFLISGSNVIQDVAGVAAGRNGVAFVGQEQNADAADLARRVSGARADGVLLDINGAADPSFGAAVRALRARFGRQFPIIALEAFPISALRKVAGPAAEGIYVVSGAPPTAALGPRGQAWVRAFAASRPDHSVTPYAPLAAQAADVLLDAIARSDGTRASVNRAVRQMHVRGGILGDFSFAPDGNLVPRPITVLRIDDRAPPGAQPTFRGAVVDRQITVGGQLGAPPRGTPVTIDEGLRMPSSQVRLDCSSAADAARCAKASDFHAGQAGAALICPTGGMVDGEFSAFDGTESRVRTLTCTDGSTLRMILRMVAYADQPKPYLARITWTWVITGGTGRLAKVRGEGLLDEMFRFSFTTRTVTGRMSGYLRTS